MSDRNIDDLIRSVENMEESVDRLLRAAAVVGSNMYRDTAEGIEKTRDGDFFSIPGGDGVYSKLYRNDDGSAEHIIDFHNGTGSAAKNDLQADGGIIPSTDRTNEFSEPQKVGEASSDDEASTLGQVKSHLDEAVPARKGPDIWTPDPLRAAIEARTGGRMTVVYSNAGAPSIFHVVPRMTYSDLGFDDELGSGNLTAFEVGGTEKSEILVAAYQAYVHDGEALSLPGRQPATNIDWDDSKAACEASGFHLMTVHEWAAIALWCKANSYEPTGNTDEGKSHDKPWQRGIATSQDSGRQILTGTGPAEWRHDGTWDGISDLVGNVWEWLWGAKIQDGRIHAVADNDTSVGESDWQDTGVDITDAEPWTSSSVEGSQLTDRILFTYPGIDLEGRLYVDDEGERFPRRGGSRRDGSDAGLAALALTGSRSSAGVLVGFRAAFAP